MSSKFAGLEIAVDKPARLMLSHPVTRQPLRDSEGHEAFIELFSVDSAVARKHQQTIQKRRLSQRGTRIRITPEELESESVELLSALTTGWYLVTLDGRVIDLPFTIENARELYAAPSLAWVREQVDEFVADRGNYSTAS